MPMSVATLLIPDDDVPAGALAALRDAASAPVLERRPLLDLEANPALGPEQREQDRHAAILPRLPARCRRPAATAGNQKLNPTLPPTPQ